MIFDGGALAAVRLPLGSARTLPREAYVDDEVFAHELATALLPAFHLVGRESDLPLPGGVRLETVLGSEIVLTRAPDLALRGFHNVCLHRGSALVDGSASAVRALVCPYHGQAYDLAGRALPSADRERPCPVPPGTSLTPVRVGTWGGFVFVSSDAEAEAPPLLEQLAPVPAALRALGLRSLRHVRRSTWELAANWKLVVENFLESHHYPTVHPSLERLTPHRLAETLPDAFPWNGGLTILDPEVETVSEDGQRNGRSFLPGLAEEERDRVRDYHLFPTTLISRQPDYLLTYRVEPLTVNRTRVTHDLYVHAASSGPQPDVVSAWDRTNAEDARIIERQQRGIAGRGYRPGLVAGVEDGLRRFLNEMADVYEGRGAWDKSRIIPADGVSAFGE